MSRSQELNRRRIISVGTGQCLHPERPCVPLTICSCRWDLLRLPFACPTAMSSGTPCPPASLGFIPTLSPQRSLSVLTFQKSTNCPQMTSQYASVPAPILAPPRLPARDRIFPLDTSPPDFTCLTFGEFIK